IVPHSSAVQLSPRQIDAARDYVNDGGRLVTDGLSPLSNSLGVRGESRSLKVETVKEMLFGTAKLTWNPVGDVERFNITDPLATSPADTVSELPVAVLAGWGRGRFIYLGTRFDPTTTYGYSRFPHLVHYALAGFNLKLPLQRAQLELYFDPGLHRGGDDI